MNLFLQARDFLRKCRYAVVAMCVVVLSQSATAELNIEVTDGIDDKVPIAVFPFAGESPSRRSFSRIIMANLERSGLFALLPSGGDAPPQGSAIPDRLYKAWLDRGIEKAVFGRYVVKGDKRQLVFELVDAAQRRRLLAYVISVSPERPWEAAHIASDYIYKQLTGSPGAFNTKLALITSQRIKGKKRRFALHVSDADGHNAEEVFSTAFQIMSPTWSPDGQSIAYVSYENGRPGLYVQRLSTAERLSYVEHTGQAISPDWSPDGRYIAYSGSVAGNYDIYLLDLHTLKKRRMTKGPAIDAEPNWAPDGSLYFTSDRDGVARLYRLDNSGTARRVVKGGGYSADVDVSPDGDRITYMSGGGGAYAIVVRNLKTGRESRLGKGLTDADPKFTPNGQMVSHLMTHRGRSVVGLYTTDGSSREILPLDIDNIRSIAWSPIQVK